MSERSTKSVIELRSKAERALARGHRAEVTDTLEALARVAPEGSEPAAFAHRHLAELHLEENPWRAALHLRRVMKHRAVTGRGPDDDVLHALMGLCQALLGNYGFAVSAYRRALKHAPDTPWYHHNLGHLLDVALGDHVGAERHLRQAANLEPNHDEIIASLAHCVARQGGLEEALMLAKDAVRLAPDSAQHVALLDWVASGAPASRDKHRAGRSMGAAASGRGGKKLASDELALAGELASWSDDDDYLAAGADADVDEECDLAIDLPIDPLTEDVDEWLSQVMMADDCSAEDLECAEMVWEDYALRSDNNNGDPAVYAAATHYAVGIIRGGGKTQSDIASRYGVSTSALGQRYREMRQLLDFRKNDPRYLLVP